MTHIFSPSPSLANLSLTQMLLVIDNYDSFVHNLTRYFQRLGSETCVMRNDAVSIDEIQRMDPQAIVLSPGPCTPDQAGISLDIVREFHETVPLLGVCLGHQAIAHAFGGRVLRGERPWHGRKSKIIHSSTGLFAGIPSPLSVGRYHSLVVESETLPTELVPTAWTENHSTLMAVVHRDLPVFGVQFHPESILTEYGYELLANFLQAAGIETSGQPAELGKTESIQSTVDKIVPDRPVTF